jgi:hypothetical protein
MCNHARASALSITENDLDAIAVCGDIIGPKFANYNDCMGMLYMAEHSSINDMVGELRAMNVYYKVTLGVDWSKCTINQAMIAGFELCR